MFTPDLKEWQEADGTGFWGGQRKMWVLFSGDPWRDQPLQPPAKLPGSGPVPPLLPRTTITTTMVLPAADGVRENSAAPSDLYPLTRGHPPSEPGASAPGLSPLSPPQAQSGDRSRTGIYRD